VNALLQVPAVLLVVVTWLTSTPTSLADAARREAFRRQVAGPSIANFTNASLPPARPAPSRPAPAEVPPPLEPPPSESAAGAEPDEPVRDEAWWRARMANTQTALERDQVLADALQSRVNALQSDVIFVDDPAQQAVLRQQLGRALGELERLQEQLEADRQEITDIREEARRQGVPPGWIR
jgi:hypothetical protein